MMINLRVNRGSISIKANNPGQHRYITNVVEKIHETKKRFLHFFQNSMICLISIFDILIHEHIHFRLD